MFEKGLGVKQDYVKASKLFEKGCNGGDSRSCFNLGVIYSEGEGVEKNGKVIYNEVYFNGYSIKPTMHNFSKLKEYITFAECLIRNNVVRIDCDLTTDINIANQNLVENQKDVLTANKLDIKRNAIDKFKEIL